MMAASLRIDRSTPCGSKREIQRRSTMLDKVRVLIIDDDQEIVAGVVIRLQAAGYETQVASDGVGGVTLARQYLPDMILLDMRMPTWDGMRVLSELQATPDTAHIPVVMLSASLGDRQRSLRAGARLFLSKPYDGAALVKTMSLVMEEARANHQQ
jgi:DNA-binding response OmpR family regulator